MAPRPGVYQQLDEYYAISSATSNLYAAWAKQQGLSYHALFILYEIYYSEGGCRQSDICRDLLFPKQTVHSVLKALEREGFLAYRTDPRDRRNKKISLTPAGAAYAGPILEGLFRLECAVLEKMPPEAVRRLIDSSRLFYEKLKETMNGEL